MLPAAKGARRTKLEMLIYTLLLLPLGLLPYGAGMGGALYAVGSSALGLGFVYWALRVCFDVTHRSAQRMFRYSLVYLAGIFGLLLIERLLP